MKTIKRTTRKETTSSESTIVETVDNERLRGDGGGHAPTDYEWTYLSRFEVKISVGTNDRSAKVFRNGRQQVKVDVYLTARDGKNDVVDLRTVYQNLKSHIDLVDERGYLLPAGWRVDWEPNGYQYNEVFLSSAGKKVGNDGAVSARALEPAATADPLIVTYYITTTSAYPLTISASITPPVPNAAPIRSGSANAPDPGDHGSITITPVDPPYLGMVGSEGLTGFYFAGTERYETSDERVIDWYLSLRYANGSVALKELVYGTTTEEAPCIQWDNHAHGPWRFHFMLTAQPDSSNWVSAGLPPRVRLSIWEVGGGPLFVPSYTVYPTPAIKPESGKLAFMTCTSKNDRRFCNSQDEYVPNRMASTTSVIDIFGNIYRLAVEFPAALDELAVRVLSRDSQMQVDAPRIGSRTTRSETQRTETETVETFEEDCFPYPIPGEAPGYLPLPRLPSGHGS